MNQTLKFTAELSERETNFFTTNGKGERFKTESVLDLRTHLKPTETFQYTHFSTCPPSGVTRGLIKGEHEALRLLRTYSLFEGSITNLKTHLLEREHPENYFQSTLSEVTFEDRNQAFR